MLPVSIRNKFAIVENESQKLTRQTGNIGTPENQECTKKHVL